MQTEYASWKARETVDKIRVLLWGYDKSAEDKLKKLLTLPAASVMGVVIPTNRDKAVLNRMKTLALKYKIKVYEPRSLKNNSFCNSIISLKPDIFIVDSYTKLIPKSIFELPRLGAYNFHPGKLPEYRGAHVLNWAIINGEEDITLTVHRINEKFDCGNIVFAEKIKISFLDNINTIFDKVSSAGVLLAKRLLDSVRSGKVKVYPQTESNVKQYPLRTPNDGKIDWNQNSMQIYNLIRALLPPWPCAFFTYKGKKIKVREAYPIAFSSRVNPGIVLGANKNAFCVSTIDTALLITKADKMDFVTGEKLS